MWQFLILGILDIFVALLAFRDPGTTLETVVSVFGIMAVVQGIMILFLANKMRKLFEIKSIWMIIPGILAIVTGLFILTNILDSVMALPYVFATWFIIDAITDLIRIRRINRLRRYIWPGASAFNIWSIATEIITLILGIFMLFKPGTANWTIVFMIGFYFLLKGITYIITAFV